MSTNAGSWSIEQRKARADLNGGRVLIHESRGLSVAGLPGIPQAGRLTTTAAYVPGSTSRARSRLALARLSTAPPRTRRAMSVTADARGRLAALRSYTAAQITAMGKQGKAYKNPDGSYSYPIATTADLKNAVRAVGRAGASHNVVRRYIILRTKSLGQLDLIPKTWASDGSLKS